MTETSPVPIKEAPARGIDSPPLDRAFCRVFLSEFSSPLPRPLFVMPKKTSRGPWELFFRQ